jgi:glycosyltransferase involved in cell wall biosynthesis
VNYFARSRLSPGRYFYAPELGRACEAHVRQFDVVYISGTWTYPLLSAASQAHRAGVPYVITPHGSFMEWAMQRKGLKKRLYMGLVERRQTQRAAAIHCTSQLELHQIQRWKFGPPAVLIPNAVNLEAFKTLPPRGGLRRQLGISDSALVSLFVGRLHTEKRVDRMIEVFARVVPRLTDAHLVLVGPDEDNSGERARQLVAQLGLGERVHFAGLLTGQQLLQAYADSDLLVLLSHRESFGMVVVEGMAAGLPVLVSTEVGVGHEAAAYGAGLVVNADSDQAEEAWVAVLSSPEQRRAMAQAGCSAAYHHFSSRVVAGQMTELFRQVIDSRTRRMSPSSGAQ